MGLARDTGEPSSQTPAVATTSAAGDGSGEFAARRAGTAVVVSILSDASVTETEAEGRPPGALVLWPLRLWPGQYCTVSSSVMGSPLPTHNQTTDEWWFNV